MSKLFLVSVTKKLDHLKSHVRRYPSYCIRSTHRWFQSYPSFPSRSFRFARPRLAQAWLQYFLTLPYSRLARNGFPHSGQMAVRVDFQFSGCGFLFFHAYLQGSEQNILGRPLPFSVTAAPQLGQNRFAISSSISASVFPSISVPPLCTVPIAPVSMLRRNPAHFAEKSQKTYKKW